jgi:hypothetical protein
MSSSIVSTSGSKIQVRLLGIIVPSFFQAGRRQKRHHIDMSMQKKHLATHKIISNSINIISIMIVASSNHQPNFCYGLVMLLEAAEHYNKNIATPPCNKMSGGIVITSSFSSPSKSKIVYSPSPPKKRYLKKYSPFGAGKLSPVKKLRNLNYGGSGSPSAWKRLEFGSVLHLNTMTITNEPEKDAAKTTVSKGDDARAILLYDNEDDHHINAIHNIVRRDIWEGFVVDASDTTLTVCDDSDGKSDARRCGRLARYDGTVGFRCRFCKNEPPSQRADRSAVYPRSLERIYHANIRFQRDHIE